MPPRCPKKLYNYLVILREAILTGQPLKGRNTQVDPVSGKGTIVSADECPPCP